MANQKEKKEKKKEGNEKGKKKEKKEKQKPAVKEGTRSEKSIQSQKRRSERLKKEYPDLKEVPELVSSKRRKGLIAKHKLLKGGQANLPAVAKKQGASKGNPISID